MTKKTILIFGAGINQLELIREAKNLGVNTVVIDPSENPPGKVESDLYFQVDGKNYKATKEIAINHKVDGIVTGQMEKPLSIMAQLAEDLGFIFNTKETIRKSLDKWLMKLAFQKANVPCARAKLINLNDQFDSHSLDGFSFPLIIKPKDAFSSRGVYKVNSFNEILSHIEETRSYASNGDILIEEFLEGKEYSVESITFNGKTSIIQITEKFITAFPNTVELGHFQPAILSVKVKDSISTVVKEAIKAIGIDNSASHAEVMLTTFGPKMIEIGARLGGDFISSYLTKASTGISMDKVAIQIALGTKPKIKKTRNYFSYIKYFVLPVGKKVIKIESMDDLANLNGLVFMYIFVKPGDIIQPIIHSALRPGCYIVESENKDEIFNLADNIEKEMLKKIILK